MLEDLEQAAERVPAEERTPELLQLLEFKQCMEACEGHFRAVGKRLKAAQAGGDSSPPVGDIEADTQPDDVFQGLVQFVRAVALGAEAAGVGLCSGEALSLLKESLLQPLISKGEDGTYQAHRPSVVCPQPTPTNVVQLLAAGVFLHVTGNPEAGVAMLSAALSGVWPPSRELQRRLVGGQFVPTAAVAAEGLGKKTAADSTAAETAGGDGGTETQAFAAGVGSNVTGTGTGTGPTSPQAQPATDASSSAANEATSGSPEAAADTADASSGGAGSEPRTPYAQALSEALERCGAGVSEAQLHKSALVLRLFLGCRAVGEQAAAAQKSGGGSASLGPSFQAILRSLLLDCQQLLDLDPSCMHAYVWAAQLVLYAKWPLDPARVAALLREGGQRAKAARCWLAAGEVQHDHALWLLNSAAEERNVAVRHASLLEAGQLLDGVKDMEGRLKGWMPAGRLDQLAERRQQLSGLLLKLQAGHLRSLGAVRPVAGLPSGGPACSFCGAAASHLKTCAACKAVGYCSRGCQVKDWKLGHRQRCSELAAAAAASGAGQATPAAAGGES